MARLFVNVGDNLEVAAGVVTPYPVTMACWFYSTSNSASQYIMTLNSTADTHFNALQLRGDQAGDPVWAQSFNGSSGNAAATTGYTTSTWQHAAAIFSAANARAAYLNGGNKGTNTTSISTNAPNTTNIGNRYLADRTTVGAIANAAMWNGTLTDADILQLAKGACPLNVKPEYLVAYWPLVGKLTTEIDIVGGYGLSITGAVSVQSGTWVYQSRGGTGR